MKTWRQYNHLPFGFVLRGVEGEGYCTPGQGIIEVVFRFTRPLLSLWIICVTDADLRKDPHGENDHPRGESSFLVLYN